MGFNEDIQSRDTNLFPIVEIGGSLGEALDAGKTNLATATTLGVSSKKGGVGGRFIPGRNRHAPS